MFQSTGSCHLPCRTGAYDVAHCIGKLMSGELCQEKISLISCFKHPEGSGHVESNAEYFFIYNRRHLVFRLCRALDSIQTVKAHLYSKDHHLGATQKSATNCHIPCRNGKGDKLSHPSAERERRQIVTFLGGPRRATNCHISWRDAKRRQIVTFSGSSSVLSETA